MSARVFVYQPEPAPEPVIPDGTLVGWLVLHNARTGEVYGVSPKVLVVQLDGESFIHPIEEGTTHE